ncbi:MAG: adenylate/guanylate cyclase domain-containing protein [Motiliproteus sp.]
MPKIITQLRTLLSGATEPDPALPSRVQAALTLHQASSERLVGWIQLLVVVTFSLLYLLSPKTFTSEAEFAPVPWVLGAYLLFTLVHLSVGHRRLPPDWFTYLSIAVDMSLIYILIWSFHLQYMQPPSFYLKAPTLLYVFIFIALRALRFEVKFILFAGATAILGWMAMVLYVLFADPSNTMITKDYVLYLTSNSMLLGAEFDKIISMLVVTLVLAASVHRGRRLLLNSIVEARKARDLSHFVPDQVLEGLSHNDAAPQAGQADSYQATIMFIDIANFTSISERLPPTEVVTSLNQYFTQVEQVLERHGGTINQFQGDAILASFDQPDSISLTDSNNDSNSANSALQAAIEIQQQLDSQRFGLSQTQLSSRIGINSGEVVGGMMGSAHRLIYTVHGDAVNLAARLEQLNKRFGSRILVSEETRKRCSKPHFIFTSQGEVQVKGRQSLTQVYSLTG